MQEEVLSGITNWYFCRTGQALRLDAQEPDYPEPREFQPYKTLTVCYKEARSPSIPQKRADKASVQTGQNIVTLVVDVSAREIKLQKSKEESIEKNEAKQW